MISTNQFKNGLTLLIDGEIYTIVEYQHVKPGKGGAFVRTKFRSLRTGNIIDRTYRSGEKFQEAFVEERKMQFLYADANGCHFMDLETYETKEISKELIGTNLEFLKENASITIAFYDGKVVGVELPLFVELKVTECEPGLKGDTAKSAQKQVKLETGASVSAPLFINVGDTIKIDTRTREYVERVL